MISKAKNLFKKYRKFLKRFLAASLSAFVLFLSPGVAKAASNNPVRDGVVKEVASQTTYWKNKETGGTVEVRPCTDKGLCVTVLDVDYNSKKAQEMYRDGTNLLDIDEHTIRDPKNPYRDNIKEVCGLKFKKKFQQYPSGNWGRGDFLTDFMINVNRKGQLEIGGRVLVITLTENFNKTSKPQETCMDRIVKEVNSKPNTQPAQNIARKMEP